MPRYAETRVLLPLALALLAGGCNRAGSSSSGEVNNGLSRLAGGQVSAPPVTDTPTIETESPVVDLAAISQAALDIESLRGSPVEVPADAGTPLPPASAKRDTPASMPVARGAATESGQNTESFVPAADLAAADQAWSPAPAEPALPTVTGNGLASLSGATPEATPTTVAGVTAPAPEAQPQNTQPPQTQPAEPISPGEQMLATLATMLAKSIREKGESPAALATLEFLSPGALAQLDDDASPLRRTLSDEDVRTLASARAQVASDPDAARSAADHIVAALTGVAPTPAPVSQDVDPAAAPSNPEPLGLRLPAAILCSRVQSFGKYEPLPSDTFLAGQSIRAILYTEVDGFTNRDLENGKKQVELAQALALYADSDGLAVWKRPERSVKETTRNTRRDFYLVQEIELPKTLTPGKYQLRVTVSDKASGATTSAIVPLSIVSDPTISARR